MKDTYKTILYDIFQKLIIVSVFLIPCFYWPQHEPRLMKFICLQTTVMILLGMSFLFSPKRTISSFYPAFFLLLGFLNLFTHGMAEYVNVGLNFITIAVIGIYVISNYLHEDFVSVVKKAIILVCLLNCVLYITQKIGINIIFKGGVAGFLCYPATLGMLCAISILLCWNIGWKWLCPILGISWFLCYHEYSPVGGLVVAISLPFWKGYWKILLPLAIIGIGLFFWKDMATLKTKFLIRMKFQYPVLQEVWARPLDGLGLGAYRMLPNAFFGFDRGNMSELHCEPLDLLLSMGLIGVACVAGWIRSVRNMPMLYKQIFVVILSTSCFHSMFHFADSLWICVVVYALMEIERNAITD